MGWGGEKRGRGGGGVGKRGVELVEVGKRWVVEGVGEKGREGGGEKRGRGGGGGKEGSWRGWGTEKSGVVEGVGIQRFN